MLNKKIEVISIAKGISVEAKNFYFSEDADIQIKDEKYSLRSKVEYDKTGVISRLLVYHPEGQLEYTKDDLIKDKNVLKNYGYKFNIELTYCDGTLRDIDDNIIAIDKLNEKILRSKNGNKVTLYYLK